MFKYVPLKCVDETTVVNEDALREYIYCAIIEEDPTVKKFHKTFQKYAEKISDVDKKIKTISKMVFLGNGTITIFSTAIGINAVFSVVQVLYTVL